MKVGCVFVLFIGAFIGLSYSSAIPVWELLKKEEKMSFIYSIFAKEIEEFCESSSAPNCNKEFLKYGLEKLKDMSVEQLDAMDPYQRGSNNIIWESIMSGHKLQKTTPKPHSSTTSQPNSYDDESLGQDLKFDPQVDASIKIENIYRVAPPKEFIFNAEKATPLMTQIMNVISFFDQADGIKSASVKRENGVPAKKLDSTTKEAISEKEEISSVVPVPEDEDLKEYLITKIKLPNL